MCLVTASCIIAAVDQEDNQWLVTADQDGLTKVWNISEYCIRAGDDFITNAPRKNILNRHAL